MTNSTLKISPELQPPDNSKISGSSGHAPTDNIDLRAVKDDKDKDIQQLQDELKRSEDAMDDDFFLRRSIEAFEGSDPFFQTNVLPRTQDSLKAYNNRFSANSAMGFDGDPDNTTIYRPKTRTAINKNKAATFASFFSNMDVVSIEAENPSDKTEVVSAAITKALLNYRLRKSIPWPMICLGGFDDAMTQGLCIGYVEWEMTTKSNKTVEKPVMELVPLENMRWSPSADWADIVNSTPFLIMLEPTYIGDLKDKMNDGKFIKLSDQEITSSYQTQNKTKQERSPNNIDPTKEGQKVAIDDYQTVIVQLHIHRIKGEDWIWYTLNNTVLLSRPVPLEEIHFHGHRPFVIGSVDIEPHNAFVTPFPQLVSSLQDEMNILANQRITNVDMAMNRKWRVDPDAGYQFDERALVSNEVGSVVFAPKDAIEALDQPDVTQNAYQEQMSLDQDFNQIAGDTPPQQNLTQKQPTDSPFRTQQMLNSSANMVVDARLKCYALTFVEPLFRLLILLEQYYETDETIIAVAGQQANMFIKENGKMNWSNQAKQLMGPPHPDFVNQMMSSMQQPSSPDQSGMESGSGQPPTPQAGMPPMQGGVSAPPNPLQSSQPQESGALPPGVDIQALLTRELVVNVNVGLNATSPDFKLQRFQMAIDMLLEIMSNPGHVIFDMVEIFKEIMALCGYGDGKRFMQNNTDPDVSQLKTQLLQMMQKLKAREPENATKLQVAREGIASRERIAALDAAKDNAKLKQEAMFEVLEHARGMQDLQNQKQQQAIPSPGQPAPQTPTEE